MSKAEVSMGKKGGVRFKGATLVACLLLMVGTLGVFWQVKDHDFIHLDDYAYVVDNPYVNKGLTFQGIQWAFTTFWSANWHPLTWISHMLDCQLFGLNPGMHHLSGLFFHMASTLLLFLILRRTTGFLWRSAVVAGLFAIHPLHVESVAWVAERKDVLSTLFWMLTLWLYVDYVERRTSLAYGLCLLAFALGLMAKQMLVTLPFVMLLMDHWPLGRTNFKGWPVQAPLGLQKTTLLSLIKEKIPFFALSALASLVILLAQRGAGAVASMDVLPLSVRIANALVSYVSYMGKMFWPMDLCVFYPHPGLPAPWLTAGSAILLASISALILLKGRRRHPYLILGWLWYVGTLVPVIGLVQIGAQAMADRYTYVPLIGLFILVVWLTSELAGVWKKHGRVALSLCTAAALICLLTLSYVQTGFWKNSITLFSRALQVTTGNWMAHNALGTALKEQGRVEEAIGHYLQALHYRPTYDLAHDNMGLARTAQGDLPQAETHFREAIRLNPNYAVAHDNLGVVLARQGKLPEAITHLTRAISLQPNNAKAHNNLGNALALQGRLEEAVQHYQRALEIDPHYASAKQNLEQAQRASSPKTGSPWRTRP